MSRLAAKAAQGLLQTPENRLIIDGKWGSFTNSIYEKADLEIRSAVDRILESLGTNAKDLYGAYQRGKAAVSSVPASVSSSRWIFDNQVVPALIREGKKYGFSQPLFLVAVCRLESASGDRPIPSRDSTPTYNYGGIKHRTVPTTKVAPALTTEYLNGVKERVMQNFAHFESADEFAKAMARYVSTSRLYGGVVSVTDPVNFANILMKGGYATDPVYNSKLANMATETIKRYA